MALVVTLAQAGAATPAKAALELTVTNDGDAPARFCVYHTPFEGMRNAFLDVTDAAGKPVQYIGMMAKRSPPTAKDWRTVAPGARLRATFDLRQGYLLVPGRYTVRFAGADGLPASAAISVEVK